MGKSSRGPRRFWMTGALAVVAASLGGARSAAAEEQRHTMTRPSRFSVAETVQRLEASVHRRGGAVFACIEQAHDARVTGHESTLVMVLESSQGGTPVLMRGEGVSTQSVPLSLIVRPVSEGASEVIFPTDFGQWEDWQELPQELAADFAELPGLVADALK
jgi:uncharacterized protein (DUF302 family)